MCEDLDVKNGVFQTRYVTLIKMLFSPRLFFVSLGLLLLVGCTSATPQTQQQPETPSSDAQRMSKESDNLQPTLDVQLIPEEAGTVLLNPMPLGENRYVSGITVTITVVPQPGWVVEE
jgi:hypothetical protein